jgi:hypothetical protein
LYRRLGGSHSRVCAEARGKILRLSLVSNPDCFVFYLPLINKCVFCFKVVKILLKHPVFINGTDPDEVIDLIALMMEAASAFETLVNF